MRSWIKAAARAGYAARGVVYVVVGLFAMLAAFGRSEAKGTKGALEALLTHPLGTVLVALLALGLAAIASWRAIQAIRDTDDHGSDAKGLAVRVGLFAAGLSYAALGALAAGLLIGSRVGTGSGDPSGGWLSLCTALVLSSSSAMESASS
jgi:hypothetical protein